MPILSSVEAYGGFIDKEETKLGIEDGFDFTILLDEEEAVDFSNKNPAAKDFKLIIRISCTGIIEDAVYTYKTDDPDLDIRDFVDEEHEDAVTELVNVMGLGDIATSATRADMMVALRDISELQPDDDMIVIYGTDYDKYLEAYNGYIISVLAHGRLMITKHVDLSTNEAERWVPFVTNTTPKEYVRWAKDYARKYNIIDDYALEPQAKLDEKLYAISDEGRAEGEEMVRDMSEDPIMPIYMHIREDAVKIPPDGVLPKVRVRLRDVLEKNSHK